MTLILLARLAVLEADRSFARRATALTATAPLFAVLAAYVIFDMWLALCVTIVWTALAREVVHGPDHGRRAAMFTAVALGLLVKGPVMLAWAIGGSLGAALLLRGRGPLRWLGWWPGWVIVLTFAGGWFALASSRYPEFPRYVFLEETFERLTTGSFRREQPWWFVPVVLAAGTLPWSLATPWRWPRTVAPAPGPGGPLPPRSGIVARVALGFVLFAAIFFTFSHSKLVTYLLPAIPALGWLAAAAWSESVPRRRPGWILFLLYGLLAAGFEARRWATPAAGSTAEVLAGWHLTAAVFACAAALALIAALQRRPELAFVAALLFTPIVLGADLPELRQRARAESGAPLAEAIEAAGGGGPVQYHACYSPGTDFLLKGDAMIVRRDGLAGTTSNYQERYRDTLMARGQWTPLAEAPHGDAATVLVFPAKDGTRVDPGWRMIFRDRRFVAYRR
jgi:4-amino-4-deoxy-L-arabinose transferase-like glycosyltransferase